MITVSTDLQALVRVRRQQQEQRFRRRDQDVGRRRAGTSRAPTAGVSPVRTAIAGV